MAAPAHTRKTLLVLAFIAVFCSPPGSTQTATPSIDDLLNLKRVGAPAISPDGRLVAYTVRETNWDENAYETEIWIGDGAGQARQLTNAAKSSQQPAWSRGGQWLGFISDRDGKRQVYRIAVAGGEAERLTKTDEGVNGFAWSPSGSQIAFTSADAQTDAMKTREKRWGDVRMEDLDQRFTHLYVLDLASRETKALTSGNFVVGGFDWSPDGSKIAFDHRASSDPADGGSADISIVSATGGAKTVLVSQSGPDSNPVWSPDGTPSRFTSTRTARSPSFRQAAARCRA
jgi:Tol biopolymer transport system component